MDLGSKENKGLCGARKGKSTPDFGGQCLIRALTRDTVLASEDGRERTPRSRDPCGAGSKAAMPVGTLR